MNRRNDCLIHLTPIKAQAYSGITPNRRLDQDVTSSYIHIKNYNYEYCMRPPPPLLFKLLIYNTLTKKGFDPPTQTITQNFTTNWFIKILIQTLKDDNMFGFFFRGWVGTRVLYLSGWYISSFSVCIYPVHYSNLKLITAL